MEPRSGYPPPEDDWWRSEMGKKTCPKCMEDRLTHIVKDGWGERNYCQVCSFAWFPKTHATWQPKVGSTGE